MDFLSAGMKKKSVLCREVAICGGSTTVVTKLGGA